MKKVSAGVDVERIVWHTDGENLHVTPWPEDPGYVHLCTRTPEQETYWGKVSLPMPPELARTLGKALIACADEQEAEQQPKEPQ